METVECETNKKIVPDPRQHGLTEDFIYVEQEWGSLFYKHMGKQTRKAAKNLCSRLSPGEETNSVHLPIPRFHEENEFYKTHFGSSGQNTDLDITLDEGLWLDVSYDVNEGLKSADGHSFIKYVRSFVTDKYNETFDYWEWRDSNIGYDHRGGDDVSYLLSLIDIFDEDRRDYSRKSDVIAEEFIEIKKYDWINLTDMNVTGYFIDEGEKYVYMADESTVYGGMKKYEWEKYVFMTNTGEWQWINENEADIAENEAGYRYGIYGNEEYDTVCVYNIIPDECSECSEESFCRYTDSETECDCQKMTKGEYCEIDSCSQCQNGGFCKINNITPDGTNPDHDEIKCICPYPFHGDYCQGTNIIYARSSKCRKALKWQPRKSPFSVSSVCLFSSYSLLQNYIQYIYATFF